MDFHLFFCEIRINYLIHHDIIDLEGDNMIKQLTKNVYLITKGNLNLKINSLSYLIISGEEAVLIEPGSLIDFDDIYKDILSIIDPQLIKYIIITHPDPDLTSSLPLFEKKLGDFKIVTEWRTKEIIQFYGLRSEMYLIKENDYQIRLKSGRLFRFIMTPFLHHSGSFITYDQTDRILFSGDLFGGISSSNHLFADIDYVESMSIFHENYMPSSDFLRPIMKDLLDYDISLICPQHGKVIKDDFVRKSIVYLYHLDFYNTPKKIYNVSADPDKIDFKSHLIQVLIRLNQLYPKELIENTFIDSSIKVLWNPIDLETNLTGYSLWNRFFDVVYSKKGDKWLNALETLVNRVSMTYRISKPQIYDLRTRKLEEQNNEMTKKYSNLETSLNLMNDQISKTKDQLMRCPVTGLYNKEMASIYLQEHIDQDNGYLFSINIDQIIDINREFSTKQGDDTMNIFKYIINNQLEEDELFFRGSGSSFLLLKQKSNDKLVEKRAETIRNLVAKSDQFIEPISVSMGIVKLKIENMVHPVQQTNDWFYQVEAKLNLAKNMGPGSIVFKNVEKAVIYNNNILLVDEEQININLITRYLEDHSFRVYQARNPIDALMILDKFKIDFIISEINLSKLDGFSLKKSVNDNPKLANIPFIFLSHMKNEILIDRANRLKVDYFIKKPFYMTELLGLIERSIR